MFWNYLSKAAAVLQLIPSIIGIVQLAESAITDPGSGAKKKELATGLINGAADQLSQANVIKGSHAATIQAVSGGLVDATVSALNLAGLLKAKLAPPEKAPAAPGQG